MKDFKEIFSKVEDKYRINDEELNCGVNVVYYKDENEEFKFYIYSGNNILKDDYINSSIYDYLIFNKFFGKESWKIKVQKAIKRIAEEVKAKTIKEIGLPPSTSELPDRPVLDPIELEKMNPFKAKAAIKHYNELMEIYNLQISIYKSKKEIWEYKFLLIIEEAKERYNCGTISIKTEDYLNCKKELLHLLWENGYENSCLNTTMYKNFKVLEES